MAARLPICVIGGGQIGQRHAEVATASDKVDLLAVIEPGEARRGELAALGLPVFAALEDAPADVRAAIVATPTQNHGDAALGALDRGCAVLVEKPIATTLAEADALCDAAEQRGLPLLTGHHRRCHPFVASIRASLPEIGALVAVQGAWLLRKHDSYYEVDWRRQPGAGPIMTNLSHEIDMLRHLAGEIVEISALTSNTTRGFMVEDTAAIALRFENGALGTFLISDAAASPWFFEGATGENPILPRHGEDCLRFVGDAGALSFPSGERWGASGGGEIEWRKPLRRIDAPAAAKVDPLAAQVDLFADLLGGSQDTGLATGRDGRATLAATLATLVSAETGRPCAPKDVPAEFRIGG